MLQGGGTIVLEGDNAPVPAPAAAGVGGGVGVGEDASPLRDGHGWAAGGGESLLRETLGEDVTMWVVHAYDGETGDSWLNLLGLAWDGGSTGDWPRLVAL